MNHWDSCNAIERRPDKVSGAWIFENTRLPVATLFEALKNSLAIDQFLDDVVQRHPRGQQSDQRMPASTMF